MYNVDPVASVRYSWCTMCILSRCSLMYNMYPIEIIPDVLPPLPLNAPHRRLPSCWLPARAFHLLLTCSWVSDPLFSFVSPSFFLSLLFLNFYFNILVSGKKLCLLNIFYCLSEFWTMVQNRELHCSTCFFPPQISRWTISIEHHFIGLSKTYRCNQLQFQVR